MTLLNSYSICVIDIGSPRLGNIGWCLMDAHQQKTRGTELDELIPLLALESKHSGLILGLEAPLFVPVREDLLLATKARAGEGRRPWSAGAGAQVLAMNLPIMIYLFKRLKLATENLEVLVEEEKFTASPTQILVFEALVSGADKGQTHVEDAEILVDYCKKFSQKMQLPPSILQAEPDTTYFNLTAAALLQCGLSDNLATLQAASPIYKPA